jgi:Carboxypeptidase regulatory-like domain/TonB-dependent Receptor Plug Domain
VQRKLICSRCYFLSCIFLIVLLAPNRLFAQIDAGGVVGSVKDSAGAAIVGADITLKEATTGIASSTHSSVDGRYEFNGVKPGVYSISTSFNDFDTRVIDGVQVHVQQTATIDILLTTGRVQQEVTVSAEAPLLQAEDASIGQTVEFQLINDLPLETRNWGSLGQLAAGVATAPIGQNSGTPENAFYSVNGVQLYQNDFRLDGINNNIEFFGGSNVGTDATVTPPPDAIQEFKLQSGNYSAEFGHSTGAVINAVVRSGTNQLHGDLWEYVRNTIFNANDYFSNQSDTPRSPYHQNVFGGTIGGPVVIPRLYDGRNKTFFFFDYQGTRINQPSQSISTVPTAGMINSGFTNLQNLITDNSGTTVDALGRTFSIGTILDPATTRQLAPGQVDRITGLQNTSSSSVFVRDPFYTGNLAGVKNFTGATSQLNILPANRLDPNAVKLLGLYPSPNRPGFANNYLFNPTMTTNMNIFDLRIDEVFGAHDTLFGVLDTSSLNVFAPGVFPEASLGDNENQIYPSYEIAGGYTHIFTPTLSSELHVGYGHSTNDQRLINENTTGIPAEYGIQGIPETPQNGGLSSFTINGMTALGPYSDRPTIQNVSDLEITDSVTKIRGSQTFKTGVSVDDIGGDILQPPAPRGLFTYSGQFTDVPNVNQNLNGIADLLLSPTASTVGGPNDVGGAASLQGSDFAGNDYHRWFTGVYFQDDWRATRNLTLNL